MLLRTLRWVGWNMYGHKLAAQLAQGHPLHRRRFSLDVLGGASFLRPSVVLDAGAGGTGTGEERDAE